MKGFIKFIIVFSGILLLSAFLAPILYDFLPYKFERIFNRLVMVFSLTAIFLFVRIRKETIIKYGLKWDQTSLSCFAKAFLGSFAILFVLILIEILFGHVRISVQQTTIGEVLWRILYTFGAALLIGVIEEFFFRGFIFRTLRERFKWSLGVSLVMGSTFYSLLHFVSKRKPLIGPDPTFMDSLTLMKAPFMSMLNWQEIWPAFVGLFIFGLVLNLLLLRTGSLYPSIGMHAGSVFFIKIDGLWIDYAKELELFLGTNKIYDGVMGWFFIMLLGLFLHVLLQKEREIIQEKRD